MAYELSWDTDNTIIVVKLWDDYTIADSKSLAQQILEILEDAPYPMSLVIDAIQLLPPRHFTDLRTTQNYMYHDMLERIYIATGNRVVKLSMLMIFNLGNVPFKVYNTLEEAYHALEQRSSN